MTSSVAYILLIFTIISSAVCVQLEYKAEYYKNTTLFCNHKVLDLPYTPFKIYWILPDESVLQPNDVSRSHKYVVGNPPNYNLTIINVDDDDLDRYYCVILWDNSIYLVHSITIDLELDGETFQEIYLRNAMIGGICGACALAVLALGCLLYMFRYRTREIRREQEENQVLQAIHEAVKEFEDKVQASSQSLAESDKQRDDSSEGFDDGQNLKVEINHKESEINEYDNKTLELENDAIVPYAESDSDRLPPYTVCDQYSNKL